MSCYWNFPVDRKRNYSEGRRQKHREARICKLGLHRMYRRKRIRRALAQIFNQSDDIGVCEPKASSEKQ